MGLSSWLLCPQITSSYQPVARGMTITMIGMRRILLKWSSVGEIRSDRGIICRSMTPRGHTRYWTLAFTPIRKKYRNFVAEWPIMELVREICFRTAYDNGGDVARICCDVTFTSLARSYWRQEHRPCDADSLPCITHPTSAAVGFIQSLPLL